jgi:hypothetical protein
MTRPHIRHTPDPGGGDDAATPQTPTTQSPAPVPDRGRRHRDRGAGRRRAGRAGIHARQRHAHTRLDAAALTHAVADAARRAAARVRRALAGPPGGAGSPVHDQGGIDHGAANGWGHTLTRRWYR